MPGFSGQKGDALNNLAEIDGPRVAPASGGPARQLVILLHGYGADGQDLIGLAPHFARVLPEAAFVAPDGPEACAGQPFGRQWWGIESFGRQERFLGTLAAAPVLGAFIDAELAQHNLDESRLVLVGFSQGTMMALHVGPRRQRRLAGIVGYSGALVAPERLAGEARSTPPVLLVHGDRDELVPAESTLEAAEALAGAGIEVAWHFSPGQGHTIAPTACDSAPNS